MFKNIALGQYVQRDSLIHALDARMKIVITIMLAVGLFFIESFWGFLLVGAFILAVIYFARLSPKVILRSLRPVLFIVSFTFIIHLIFTKGGYVVLDLKIFQIESLGLFTGLFMATRIIILISFTSLMTLTTSPIQLTDGIEYLLGPLGKIGVPAHELAMMMTIALRFIPTLLEESEKIMKAQKARGADFETGNVFRRAKSLVPLLVPLFLSAFRRADELAIAMEARCYRGGQGRTRMKELVTSKKDWLALGVSVLLVFGLVLL